MTETALGQWKGRFPFTLECPSWIWPGDLLFNVRRLAAHVDSVELILFESGTTDSLPGPAVMTELAAIGRGEQLGYSVHLPLDVHIGAIDPAARAAAIRSFTRVVELTRPLAPRHFYVHADGRDRAAGPDAWAAAVRGGLARLLRDTGVPPRMLAIENLGYPIEQIENLITGLDLGVCIDTGHCIEYGHDLAGYMNCFAGRVAALHVHAPAGPASHGPLDTAPAPARRALARVLREFRGTVSAEVFAADHLTRTVACIEEMLNG
ncbi:MAG: cobamide remodeling phosphodiesterase CbiR [Planctomycetota bacterium]